MSGGTSDMHTVKVAGSTIESQRNQALVSLDYPPGYGLEN
jgi:hypothetical protein